ncbi:hypothetical protein BDL97_08G143800 [Sphagnum fallax]|nr:hypothetical protein BDL97_08G143800 [Sphagnum fallax]
MTVERATTLLRKSGMMMAFDFEQVSTPQLESNVLSRDRILELHNNCIKLAAENANEILHHKANLNGYLAYHTGQPYETIVQDTDRDFFMSAKEGKEYGLIDAVISNPLKALRPLPEPVPA